MPMYNLIEYSDNYSKISGSLWQYYRDEPATAIVNSESFKSKIRTTGRTPAAVNIKDVEIAVPLKHFSNFWRTLEVPLINCEINLILTWSVDCVIYSATGTTKFAITDTKHYVPVVTLSTQDNAKLLQQLKSGFQITTNWNKYISKVVIKTQTPNLEIDPNFQGLIRLFALLFENNGDIKAHLGYFLTKAEIKYYNVITNGRNVFDQPVKNDTTTYDNIRKIAAGQGNDCTTGCLLDNPCFKEHYSLS